MKVAFLTREYPPDTDWGGISRVYYTLATALAKEGHEIHVICQAVGEPRDLVDEGIFVYRVGTNPKRYSAIARINYSYHAWLRLRKLIKEYSLEIIEAPCWGAESLIYYLSKTKSIQLVVSTHSSAYDVLQTKTYTGLGEFLSLKALSYLEDFSLRRAHKIVANSQIMYNRMVEDLHIAPEKIVIVHHAIDTDKYRFTGSDIKCRLGIPDGDKIVLAVGRLEMRKGSHILCKAIPEIIENVPNVRFVLIGRDTATAPNGGSFKEYIIKSLQTYNNADNVMFIDFLPEDEFIQLYSACDVFTSPSLYESFGLVVLEAMSCGRPVVATPVGIVPELAINNLKGISIVPVGDSRKLAEALLNFLMLPAEALMQISNENRNLVEKRFSIPAWVSSTIEVYKSAAK